MALLLLAALASAGRPLHKIRECFQQRLRVVQARQNPTVKSESNTKAKGGTVSSADKAFIKDAAKGGMMEMAMGRMGEKNSTNTK